MNGWTGNEFSKFSEVLYKVTVRSKYTRALTVEIFLVGAVLHYAASMGGTEVCEFLVTNCSARVDAVRYMCRMRSLGICVECALLYECILFLFLSAATMGGRHCTSLHTTTRETPFASSSSLARL